MRIRQRRRRTKDGKEDKDSFDQEEELKRNHGSPNPQDFDRGTVEAT